MSRRRPRSHRCRLLLGPLVLVLTVVLLTAPVAEAQTPTSAPPSESAPVAAEDASNARAAVSLILIGGWAAAAGVMLWRARTRRHGST